MNERTASSTTDFAGLDISNEEYEKNGRAYMDIASTNLMEDGEDVVPAVIVKGKPFVVNDGKPGLGEFQTHIHMICVDDFMNEKRTALRRIGAKMYEDRFVPSAIYMTCTAWVSQRTDIQPKDDPSRGESLVCFGMLSNEPSNHLLICRDITRKDGKVVSLGDVKLSREQGVGAPLIEEVMRGFALACPRFVNTIKERKPRE